MKVAEMENSLNEKVRCDFCLKTKSEIDMPIHWFAFLLNSCIAVMGLLDYYHESMKSGPQLGFSFVSVLGLMIVFVCSVQFWFLMHKVEVEVYKIIAYTSAFFWIIILFAELLGAPSLLPLSFLVFVCLFQIYVVKDLYFKSKNI